MGKFGKLLKQFSKNYEGNWLLNGDVYASKLVLFSPLATEVFLCVEQW